MTRIGLLSDTHSHLDERLFTHFAGCDEIWHAGDWGAPTVSDRLAAFKPVRAVYGNIDGSEIREAYPKILRWKCEEMEVLMTHIGGYPGKYPAWLHDTFRSNPPGIFICGHSHILKVIYDKQYQFLHLNPGASGIEGFHKVKTALRFAVDGKRIVDMEIIELGLRG